MFFSSALNSSRQLCNWGTKALTTSVKPKKCLFLTGALAQIGPVLVREGVARGYEVIGCSRKIQESAQHGHLMLVKIQGPEIKEAGFWTSQFGKYASGSSEIVVINTIGTAVAPKGSTLEDINEKPLIAALDALEKQRDCYGQRVAVGNLSSICAAYFPKDKAEQTLFCEQSKEYCSSRQRLDEKIHDSHIPTTTLRPGFIFTDVRATKVVDTGHAYSPEQFAAMLVQPYIGSGNQIQQPVYVDDVATAILNGVESDVSRIINAVGPDSMTQKELFQFFTELAGRKFRPVQIPHDLALAVAKFAPKGRIAPYSVGMFRHLDLEEHKNPLSKEEFEKLVGRPLTSMKDLYAHLDKATIVLTKPPMIEHMTEIFNIMRADPEARKEFSKMALKYGPKLVLRAIKALLA